MQLKTLILTAMLAMLALVTHAQSSVTLAWDASDPTYTYKIYYGSATATYTNTVAAGTNLKAVATHLSLRTTYYFVATPTDTNKLESAFSNEISAVIPSKPTPPTGLKATAVVIVNVNVNVNTK